MGFNFSQSKRRSAVLSGTLEEFAGWTLTILCPRCRHQGVLPVSDLLVLYRGDQKFGSLVKRLHRSTRKRRPFLSPTSSGSEIAWATWKRAQPPRMNRRFSPLEASITAHVPATRARLWAENYGPSRFAPTNWRRCANADRLEGRESLPHGID
jgi:hypothetical protein